MTQIQGVLKNKQTIENFLFSCEIKQSFTKRKDTSLESTVRRILESLKVTSEKSVWNSISWCMMHECIEITTIISMSLGLYLPCMFFNASKPQWMTHKWLLSRMRPTSTSRHYSGRKTKSTRLACSRKILLRFHVCEPCQIFANIIFISVSPLSSNKKTLKN